jgi:PHP family Zn ribbon phosphoesterase
LTLIISVPIFNDECKKCTKSYKNTELLKAESNCKNCGKSKASELSEINAKRDQLFTSIFQKIPLHLWTISLSQIISGMCSENVSAKFHLKKILVKLASEYTKKVCWSLLASRHRSKLFFSFFFFLFFSFFYFFFFKRFLMISEQK